MRISRRTTILIWSIAIVMQLSTSAGHGQQLGEEYTIGVGDELRITFWQAPELNTTVKVGSDGKIELPILGRVTASSLTPSRLSETIVSQISRYNRKITQATVQVTVFASKYVYVMGQVRTPGKYTFEKIPNLWEIVLEAGGPSARAKLTQVAIIRGPGPDEGRILHVNLSEILESGDLGRLPAVYPGDTVQIPGIGEEAIGAALQEELTPKDVIYIFGGVAKPGPVPYEPEVDIMEAIVLAGGPTQTAQLEKVRVISRSLTSGTMIEVNLKEYSERAEPVPFFLQPRDVIYVPQRRQASSWVGFATEFFRITLTAATSAIVFTLIR